MKKIMGILLSASIAATSAVPVFAAGVKFSDIYEDRYSWAVDYIERMAEENYIAGYEDNTFRPDNKVTRLETIVLFARAMGSNRAENKEAVETAVKKYQDKISALRLNFGEEEVSYLLYRGVLTDEDLTKYLSSQRASLPMPRQEAAAIITKAMCGEEDAKAEVLTDTDYTDAKTFNGEYSQYIYYVSSQGIMNGMDDGSFSPENSVLRSQIAVMLARAVDKMNLYIETAPIMDMDTDKNNVTIMDEEGAEVPVGYNDNTRFYLDGEKASEHDAVITGDATLTYINDKLVFVDMDSLEVDETKKVIFQGSVTQNNKTTVTVKETDSDKTYEYGVSDGVKMYNADGSAFSGVRNIALGSYVEIDIANDRIIRLEKLTKDSTIKSAVVEKTGIGDNMYITISHSDQEYDSMKISVTDDVAVYKNNDRSDLSKIYVGDRVDISFEYGIATKIVASSNTKSYSGTIAEIVISSTPVIRVKINGEVEEYEVVPEVKITVNGETATLYDLRVGDTVKVTIESGAVLKLETTAAAVSGSPITGTVEVVNKSKGFIKIDGETIFCKDDTTTFITSSGKSRTMKDLTEGASVSVRGVMSNGAYTASLVIIED